ncbi:hypothetical protein PanWU01x14_138220, partial [Parasponia andersonii]
MKKKSGPEGAFPFHYVDLEVTTLHVAPTSVVYSGWGPAINYVDGLDDFVPSENRR